MHVRAASVSDLRAINAIALAAKASWGYSEAQMSAWRDSLVITADSLATKPTLVAEAKGVLVGVAQLDPATEPWELGSCWVEPTHMRQGVGTALLQAVKAVAARAGQHVIHIDADPNAEPFYLSQGARRVGHVSAPIEDSPGRVRPQLRLNTQGA